MTSPPAVTLTNTHVFGGGEAEPDTEYLTIDNWDAPVQYFVGRNGSGKSRTARTIAAKLNGKLLATDRLAGLMRFQDVGYGNAPADYAGIPIGAAEKQRFAEMSRRNGMATEDLYALREEPEVLLRVAAFIRRILGRALELREKSGFLDPYVRVGGIDYSLLRDEGHGLRELVVLLAATYRDDPSVLIVDEPELHLHPSMSRLWLTELNQEFRRTGRRAIVVTHEPTFLRPTSAEDLRWIWLFANGRRPQRLSDGVSPAQHNRVAASLALNPRLVSDLAFSPRPVLVEGPTDVAALATCLARLMPPEVVAQTDLVEAGGSGGVALWLEICVRLGIDVRAVADLDSLLSKDVQRTIDHIPGVSSDLLRAFASGTGKVGHDVKPLIERANALNIGADPVSRAAWLASVNSDETAEGIRKTNLLAVLRGHGLWLHPQGTLEQVLEIESKGVAEARAASASATALDEVATWVAYELDVSGDVRALLGAAVERIAHAVMEAQRLSPDEEFRRPVGVSSDSDSRLVSLMPAGRGRHRIVVQQPTDFKGYWLEFSRDTASTELELSPPVEAESL